MRLIDVLFEESRKIPGINDLTREEIDELIQMVGNNPDADDPSAKLMMGAWLSSKRKLKGPQISKIIEILLPLFVNYRGGYYGLPEYVPGCWLGASTKRK